MEYVTGGFGCFPEALPVEVDEGEVASAQFACTGAVPAEGWALLSGPEGVTIDAASGVLTWQTDLDCAGTHKIVVEAQSGADVEAGTATILVNDAWEADGNTPPDLTTYGFEYGLPVISFTEPEGLNKEVSVPIELRYAGRLYNIEIQARGATSSHYPKTSYRLDFAKDQEFQSVNEDWPQRRKLALTTLFDDNAYFRQMLCYDAWNSLSDTDTDIYSEFVVVYKDGAYWGLYMLTDHINGEWWEDYGYFEDGNLYKSVNHAANFSDSFDGVAKESLRDGYEKKTGDEEDWTDLEGLIQFVIESDDATFDAGIGDYLAVQEVYDWWALVLLFSAYDTVGKNAYFYNDPAAPGFHLAPWDFNSSLGQTYLTTRQDAGDDWDFTDSNRLFLRLLASDVHGDAIRERLWAHWDGALHPDLLNERIDGYLPLIERSMARDWAVWSAEYRAYDTWNDRTDFNEPADEIAYIRTWIQERHDWVGEWSP